MAWAQKQSPMTLQCERDYEGIDEDVGKRKIEEREDENEIKEENAKLPDEKRQKSERDYEGIDEDVVEIMKKMEDMSTKQKKKYKGKLKADDEALYSRYIEAITGHPDGSESPKKRVQSVEKEEESDSPVKGKDSPTKERVKLIRDTPLPKTNKLDGVSPAAEAIQKSAVDQYEDIHATNELPEDHERELLGFRNEKSTKCSHDGGWVESNHKKRKNLNQYMKRNKNGQKSRNEGHQGGALEKEAPASKKNRRRNKKGTQNAVENPPGHPDYVPRQEHASREYTAGGSGSQSKAWKREVENYEKELAVTTNELPKDHNKVSFGFKKAKDSNWNKDNGDGGWTESKNKKKAPKQDKIEQRGRNEGHEGDAREKEAPASKKSKKKKGKMTNAPLGHPDYVPPEEHEPRQYSAGGSGSQSKAWELQVIKRDDGSVILQEIYGDLFSAPGHYSLVHCVSADFHMGKGIAVHFKKMFGGVGELLSFNARTGQMAFLRRQERFIYYLVTKEQYFKKPSMRTLESSLAHMREHCLQNRVQFIAMPTIGGFDRLDWDNVRDLLVRMFRDTPVQITVYMV